MDPTRAQQSQAAPLHALRAQSRKHQAPWFFKAFLCPQEYTPESHGSSNFISAAEWEVVKTFFPLGIAAPVAVVCSLWPLLMRWVPLEVWFLYYFGWFYASALLFSRELCVFALEETPSLKLSAVFLTLTICTMIVISPLEACWWGISVKLFMVLVCLMFPPLVLLRKKLALSEPVAPIIAFLLGLNFGAVPSCIGGVLYFVLNYRGWENDLGLIIIVMIVWSLVHRILKPVGAYIWIKACPANKVMAPLLWSYYVHVTMGAFGMALFMGTPRVTVTFALSMVPTLLAQLVRGTLVYHSIWPEFSNIRWHRIVVYLEAFVAILARAVTCATYIALSSLNLFTGSAATCEPILRSSLFWTNATFAVIAPTALGGSLKFGESSVLSGLLGFVASLAFFWSFLPVGCSHLEM